MSDVAPPLIVANWKMQLTLEETGRLLAEARQSLDTNLEPVKLVLCPSFPALDVVRQGLVGSPIRLGAQDVSWAERGALTGEVSPLQLKELGVSYVIVGHSERRHQLNETDTMVAQKMISAIGHGLMPILCVGETADERSAGRTELVIQLQLQQALRSMPPAALGRRLCLAYEPVWAISPGGPATPEQALEVKALIEQTVVDMYGASMLEKSFRIIYGGSVDPDNICDFVSPSGFAGALVGAASLKAVSLTAMVRAVHECFKTS